MEISEKSLDVINDLIKINNDRIAGFEKAGSDLEDQDSGLIAVFSKLAGESQNNAAELTDIALQYGGDVADGTSASGSLHRTWLDIKATFTGHDLESILEECERGEDAIKAAYSSALEDSHELDAELVQMISRQQQGIVEGHNLIKSLRDQVAIPDDDRNEYASDESNVYNNAAYTETPNDFQPASEHVTGKENGFENQEASDDTGNSKLMEFFVNELKDLLWAERELVDTLPKMAEAATSAELKEAFENHLTATEGHVDRLEQIFELLGLEPATTTCDAMAGIVDEGEEIISMTDEGTAQRDVGLIFAGQKAEHYEIASYGGMVSLAKTLGYYEIAETLVLTLDEEKTADALLTEIAENHVNYDAGNEPAN